jgi:hypothetical protein
MPIDPRYLEFSRWSAMTGSLLTQYGYVPTPVVEKDWRMFADTIRQLPVIQARHVPTHTGFDVWQNWALRLNESLYGLGL